MLLRVTCALAFAIAMPVVVLAQQPPEQVVTGDPTVSVEGNSAATTGDATSGGNTLVEGSSNVFINGKPAVTVGGATNCGGLVVGGSSTVFVNGKPMATSGSAATGCPQN